ncbi:MULTISPECIES: aspartate aminotransferase family protein [Halorussus]|uniref:aspartate aminotransferase family protein n=1 Tax=Halorussus TaxID=1070314 RepID=UPI0020A22F3A|nr:aspartate aminotransferase family protein [Halorussus vallis]USZ77614.1 aspartate aminotransferase family protein [Halorussus vallis]
MTEQERPGGDAAEKYDEYVMPIAKGYDPFTVERASGTTMETTDGERYLDCFSGISVTNAGHNNPEVVAAAKDQLDDLVHTCSYLYRNRPVADLAERIAEITPGDLQKTFFCNSGTEAVEGAIKLARKHTGSKEVVALEMSFHGRTLGSLALTGNKAYKDGMAPTINDVVHAPAPYRYRSPYCDLPEAEFAEAAAAELERVIATQTSDDVAAVVVEPVMGEGGIVVPPEGYLERVRDIAYDHGALLVLDEVQTGYGRTGTMFACEQFDVKPDILTQAKGIADGLPLGAFTAPAEVADSFEAGDHLSTFGGNPVCCAAALANIDALEDGIVDNAAEQGAWLGDRLAELEDRYDLVGETRGLGLMYGVELVGPMADEETDASDRDAGTAEGEPAKKVADAVKDHAREEHGVLVGVGGFYKNVIRFQPPLTITYEELERAVDALEDGIRAIESR